MTTRGSPKNSSLKQKGKQMFPYKKVLIEDVDWNGNNFDKKKYSMTFGDTPHKNLGILVNGNENSGGLRSSGVFTNGPFEHTAREIKNIVVQDNQELNTIRNERDQREFEYLGRGMTSPQISLYPN